jgi:hypothetical protein
MKCAFGAIEKIRTIQKHITKEIIKLFLLRNIPRENRAETRND